MAETRLAVSGAGGRMGQALVRLISESSDAVLTGALEHDQSEAIGKDSGILAGIGDNHIAVSSDTKSVLENCDGLIDFSTPEASCAFAESAGAQGIFHVIGTTGCTPEQDDKIQTSSEKAPIVKSGNMSLGVNLLSILVEQAAKSLAAEDFDIEVLEMHHRHKVDAPSGTALLLGQAAAVGREIDLEKKCVRVRDGITGAREIGTIGFAALRGGSVVGEHSVIFAGAGERVELAHYAQDRTLFASGALKAALWVKDKPVGLYSMRDVLGL